MMAGYQDISPLGFPELLRFADGRPVDVPEAWAERRQELAAAVQHAEYGRLPLPAAATLEVRSRQTVCDGLGHEVRGYVRLSPSDGQEVRGPECDADRPWLQEEVRFAVGVYVPDVAEPPPLVIAVDQVWLPHLRPVVRRYMSAGVALAGYTREEVAPDSMAAVERLDALFAPNPPATLCAWAWAAMRVLDVLLATGRFSAAGTAVTGHSRAGKTALLAGALDERFALVAPNGSGTGGAGLFRVYGHGSETLEAITRPDRFAYWFTPGLRDYSNREGQLPFDQHFLRALVAPRIVLSMDAEGDLWANPKGTRAAQTAAQPAFDLLQVPDHNRSRFREGGHDMLEEDWLALPATIRGLKQPPTGRGTDG